jgi:hypothetical protein
MLWAQFSAIFGENIAVFLKNQSYDSIFAETSSFLVKPQIFRRKYFKTHNIAETVISFLCFMSANLRIGVLWREGQF